MINILVIEDEKLISDIIKYNLEKEGYQVSTSYDGMDAIKKAKEINPDLIILDIMLPHKDGFDVCKEIRLFSKRPIIMLTAKDSEVDKVLGLEMGADDYVTKPFSNRELIARVKSNLRRVNSYSRSEKESEEIIIGEIVLETKTFTIRKREKIFELTHREFELLYYLAKNKGVVLTREQILNEVWGYEYLGDIRTVDVVIRRVRAKIEDNPSNPTYLITKHGLGYVLNEST